jgi:glycosyltransferase A (GT-A) superfamily protein (DUF2064 family)
MKDLKTAILIFAHSAEYEATVKPFLHSKEVFESLNQRTLALVKEANLPYFVVTEKEQIGFTFGERFTNAIQSIYDLNYDSVIAIGNDTPHLTAKQLKKAHSKLNTNEIVLGSSTDGGFYLLGIKKEHFDKQLFLKLPWQCQNLNRSLSKLFKVNGVKVSYLETLRDIDSIEDIKILFSNFRSVYNNLFQLFLIILSKIRSNIFAVEAPSFYLFQSNFTNKGPPYLFL